MLMLIGIAIVVIIVAAILIPLAIKSGGGE